MRNWNDIPDRRAATIIFRDFMEQHAAIKKACCDSPTEAKRQFAILGEFYLQDVDLEGQPAKPGNVAEIQIPTAAEFRVYDTRDKARHNLVVLILPSSKGKPTTEPANILIAAWPAWGPTRQQIADLEAQLVMLRQQLIDGKEGPPPP